MSGLRFHRGAAFLGATAMLLLTIATCGDVDAPVAPVTPNPEPSFLLTFPATGTLLVPPVVEAGPQRWATSGQSATFVGSFSGQGTPSSYGIDWGDGSADDSGIALAPGSISATHTYAAPGDYTITLNVTQLPGGTSIDQTVMHVTAPGGPITLLAAGDIAECGSNNRDEETARLIDAEVAVDPAAAVFTLGDNAYPNGSAADYANCYQPTWGRHRDRTFANIGNHDYDLGNADATFDYFGERAGPRGKGYYSVELGSWHIIVLNDNRSYVPFAAGSEQDNWLVADLAANTKPCVLAIWHYPRFYSSDDSTTVRTAWKPLWDRLYAARADVVLNGHVHIYERFAPMQPDGVRDDATGIRQFIVGTGGEGAHDWTTRAANSEVAYANYGIIKLTLRADGYDWQYLPIPGQDVGTDAGSGTCH